MSELNVPINQKLILTIEEASAYSGIPIRMLRKIAKSDSCMFTFRKPRQGSRLLIKREMLEEYVRNTSVSKEV